MTASRNERVALAWARQYLRGHHCPRCNTEWITSASVGVLAHRCVQPRVPPPGLGYRNVDREEILDEDRKQWRVTSPLGIGLEEAIGGEHVWYQPDHDEEEPDLTGPPPPDDTEHQ